MHRQKSFNSFDLNDDSFRHQKIQSMDANWTLSVIYLNNFLSFEWDIADG